MGISSAAGIISLNAGNCSQGAARSNFLNSWANSTGSCICCVLGQKIQYTLYTLCTYNVHNTSILDVIMRAPCMLHQQIHIYLNNPAEFVIIPALKIPRQGEVFSQRMSLKPAITCKPMVNFKKSEPVIGEDAAKVGVVGEVDSIHVPHLPLVPVRSLGDPR